MSVITPYLEPIPEVLREHVTRSWDDYLSACERFELAIIDDSAFLAQLVRVWSVSEYVTNCCVRKPTLLQELYTSNDLFRRYPDGEYEHRLLRSLQGVNEIAELDRILREFRQREMCRIIWRDILGLSDFKATVLELSAMADICLQRTVAKHYNWLSDKHGKPYNKHGEQQTLLVVALGKLGGKELNLSSDIDLMFIYPEKGKTKGADNSCSNEEFFIQLGQRVIRSLNNITADGFVFRVDMRLRPFGSSGPLAITFNSLESYYLEQGRDWERYAMVRARVVTGERNAQQELRRIINNFVYRHYIDYSVINSLRDMKKLIQREADAKGLEDNIKRGPGGVREIEFSAQVLQLIRGGRDLELQQQNLLKIFDLLAAREYVPEKYVKQLREAYIFLRDSEHRIQAVADRQTQFLPKDDIGKARLAFSMACVDWQDFLEKLNVFRKRTGQYFRGIFEETKTNMLVGNLVAQQAQLQLVWVQHEEHEPLSILQEIGFKQPEEILTLLNRFHESDLYKKVPRKHQRRADILFPMVFAEVATVESQLECMQRIIAVLEKVLRKINFINFLLKDMNAVIQLVFLCNASRWAADELVRHPVLLEDLSDSRTLYAPLDQKTLSAELRQFLVGVPQYDLEQQMNTLRRFKHTHVLRVAASDINGTLPLMKVSDHLTFTAGAILREVQNIAVQEIVLRHGRPTNAEGDVVEIELAIIAYGKLGGIELGYGSDLDLVFVRGEVFGNCQTDGDEPLSNQEFYTRLAQRIIYILNTRTTEGLLYEVDMRLRPSGNSGQLVTSIEGFADYQREEAWTWEHQALVRAQAVSGAKNLRSRFAQIREEILSLERDDSQLRSSVLEMRHRMRELGPKVAADEFDVKQGTGGITDIEFLVQFGVLFWAHKCQSLMVYPDNIRILEAFAAEGLMSQEDADLLSDAYRAYRSVVHANDLQNTNLMVSESEFHHYREGVRRIWLKFLGEYEA